MADIPPVHDRLYCWAIHRVEMLTRTEYWQIKVVVLSLLVCFAAAFPDYQLYLAKRNNPETWRVVKLQIQAPFTAIPAAEMPPADSNESKRIFRLFMPVVGHFLHIERAGLLAVQHVMGLLFLWAVLVAAQKVTGDKITSTFFLLAVALSFPSQWFFNSFSTNLDGPGYLLLLAAMLFPNPLIVFVLLFCASFVDERVFACFGFVVLWWKLNANATTDWNWRRMFAVDRYLLAAVAAILVHAGIRYYLTVARGFHLPVGDSAGVGLANVRSSWTVFSPSILAPFKGLTLFAVLAAIVAAANRKWSVLFCIGFVSLAVMLQSFAVGDHTRSLAYGFPLIVVSFKILKDLDPNLDLRKLTVLTLVLCFLIPSFNLTGGVVSWFTPAFPKVLRWFF